MDTLCRTTVYDNNVMLQIRSSHSITVFSRFFFFLFFRLAKLPTSRTAKFLAISLSLSLSLSFVAAVSSVSATVSCDRSAGYMYLG